MISVRVTLISETDKAYAAGFFDGEGCISIAANGAVDIRITNTAKVVLDKLLNIFGGTIKNRAQRVNKAQYSYNFYGEDGINFLITIKPYLVEKLPQVETILEYYSLRDEYKPINKPGQRGRFAHPDRAIFVQMYRDILSEQKLQET